MKQKKKKTTYGDEQQSYRSFETFASAIRASQNGYQRYRTGVTLDQRELLLIIISIKYYLNIIILNFIWIINYYY